MNKEAFLGKLKKELSGLPPCDLEERLAFYGEMIDDKVEEGLGEEEAVAQMGDVDEIVSQTIADVPLTKIVKEKIKPKRTLHAWEIVLIVLGFPLWFPLLVAVAAVALSAYVAVWAVVFSLWAAEVSLFACSLAGLPFSLINFLNGDGIVGTAVIGAALFIAGVAVFAFFGCKRVSKGLVLLTKKIISGVKTRLIKREN